MAFRLFRCCFPATDFSLLSTFEGVRCTRPNQGGMAWGGAAPDNQIITPTIITWDGWAASEPSNHRCGALPRSLSDAVSRERPRRVEEGPGRRKPPLRRVPIPKRAGLRSRFGVRVVRDHAGGRGQERPG